jgi:predicted MFS family arabinose efflux permease
MRALAGQALALAAVAAIALGLSRFAYALLLPAMRADLGWTYATAGAMNTANAAGYLAGALAAPWALRRVDARTVMLAGGWAAAGLLALHGLLQGPAALVLLRVLSGVASAACFVGGGVLAARLAGRQPGRAGLVLGIYYGGVGMGIVAASLALPPLLARPAWGWPAAWMVLGALAAVANAWATSGTQALRAPPQPGAARVPLPLAPFAFGLAGYACFGLGYIGYMTFIVTLLREQGLASGTVTLFYLVLGLAVMASSWLWAGLLQRQRGGLAMALLNALLAVATLLPVLAQQPVAVFASGVLFGAVFLSVVASTTALVRHNAPQAAWPAGIAAFTVVFAAGQIAGPALVGWVADGSGSLRQGLAVSAGLLALGALLAMRQRPLAEVPAARPPASGA